MEEWLRRGIVAYSEWMERVEKVGSQWCGLCSIWLIVWVFDAYSVCGCVCVCPLLMVSVFVVYLVYD